MTMHDAISYPASLTNVPDQTIREKVFSLSNKYQTMPSGILFFLMNERSEWVWKNQYPMQAELDTWIIQQD